MDIQRVVLHFAIIVFCFQACSSFDVKTDFDPSADFTKFRTFAFTGMTDLNKGGILDNSLTRRRLESAISRELTTKGLRQVESDQNPDLLVHYWLGVQEKQRLQDTGPPVGAYGWRGRYAWGPAYGGVTTYEYKEGTLIVDLVEAVKKELVWRATMMANVDGTAQENIELGNKAIRKAFEGYPPSKSTP